MLPRASVFRALVILPALLWASCGSVDPRAILEVQQLEGYWVLDTEKSRTNYITPTIHFVVKNTSTGVVHDIEATATFRRNGEDSMWGDCFVTIANRKRPLGPGQTTSIEMRSSGDYYTPGAPVEPEIMFKHGLFRDAAVDLFIRVGRSGFVKMGSLVVPRRLNRAPQAPPA
jgi:hypothetical protein